jgi:iron complex outermembrane receptor protein
MRTIIFFFLSILVCGNVVCQNKITGTITDASDGKPISNVSVYIPDLKTGASTDKEGTYILKNVPQGTFLVQARLMGYALKTAKVQIDKNVTLDFVLLRSNTELRELVITGNSFATDPSRTPQPVMEVTNQYLIENSATNVIDAVANVPGVSAMTDGQSISKPVIRGLGYNRVLTVNDGVMQVDQQWFDEFGIEADPDAVDRVEILKGPGSLSYGSDAISGVINLIPEKPAPEGTLTGEFLSNYQTNNGLINNMLHLAGTKKGISWSGRVDYTMAHAYQNKNDGYVLNSQFNNFNVDGTLGIHRHWGYTQLHVSYFDMATGIVDGTRDSVTGAQLIAVSYPGLNGGAPTYVFPTKQQLKSYTPLVINQRIRHTKVVWDNSLAIGKGRITGVFSYQVNKRMENNDPTIPDISDIYYHSDAATYDLRYISPLMGGFSISGGVNGLYQASQSLGTLMLIPNYNLFQIGIFAIANETLGRVTLSGGLRYDTRSFEGVDHWVDSLQTPVPPNTEGAIHEFHGFTSNFSGMSFSAGAAWNITKTLYLKGNIARGYRAPNVAECGANGVHDGTVVYEIGDPTLKPETSLEEDISFGINSKDVTFEVDGFYNNINDFIYAKGLQSVFGGDSINNSLNAAGLGAAPVYKYVQGKASLYGGELALSIHPSGVQWLEINTTASYADGALKGVPDSTKYLPFVPPAKITAELKLHVRKIGKAIQNGYFRFGVLNSFEQSKVYQQSAIYTGLNTAQTPYEYAASKAATAGYVLFNTGIGADFQSNGRAFCKVYISVNNLFDTPYMDYMSRFKYYPVNYTTGRVGVFNMGRNFSVKVLIPIGG